MIILSYDTESKSRNVLAFPLGEEGHEVAKGCTRVRMIMILDVDVTAERRHYNTHRPLKGKRLTTFCASLALLQNVFAVHLRAIPQPSGPKAPLNLRTLGPQGPINLKNPHTEGVSMRPHSKSHFLSLPFHATIKILKYIYIVPADAGFI
jgi:hypothetical protein